MADSVKSLWNNPDAKPPTPEDAKLREKHVRDSVPYNTAHSVDHLKAIVDQLQKLSVVDRSGATKLAAGSSKRIGKMLDKISKYSGGRDGR
jgi:hypothetical protein